MVAIKLVNIAIKTVRAIVMNGCITAIEENDRYSPEVFC